MATAPKTTKPPGKRIEPVLSGIRDDVTMPERAANRGSKSLYPFETLRVGQSFGVLNKSAKQLSSIVSNQNRKDPLPLLKDNQPVFKTVKQGDIDVPTGEPQRYKREFIAVDVDKAKDPDKASVRVFRRPDVMV